MEALLEFVQTSPLAIWGLFGLLILCGVGLPMPEDILLVAAGLLTAERDGSWIYASALMYVGVLAGDSLIFAMGRRYGRRLLALSWMRRWLSEGKQERISRLLDRHGSKAFFIARFMPGLRAAIFCTAGAMKVRYTRFAMFDGLAAVVSVPAFVWLGSFLWRKFGDDVGHLSRAMARTHSYSLLFASAVVTTVLCIVWVNRRKLLHASRG